MWALQSQRKVQRILAFKLFYTDQFLSELRPGYGLWAGLNLAENLRYVKGGLNKACITQLYHHTSASVLKNINLGASAGQMLGVPGGIKTETCICCTVSSQQTQHL